MGRAEDLLNGLQDTNTNNEISLLIAGENTDTEPHFVINDNRIISVPSELRTIAVQYDHNIETITFDCPRYWDGHDMSKMIVYINYERADGETGAYLAENVRVDDEDDSIMHFEWTISRNVTSASGSVTFLVCIKSVDRSGNEQEHWNSERCSDISVAPGLETGEPIEEEYPDILTQLTKKIEDVSKNNVTINDEESSTTSTYSSNKIDDLVSKKADSAIVIQLSTSLDTLERTVEGKADTSTVNQQISSLQTELSNDVSELDSALDQINAQVALKTSIDDSQSETGKTYSSSKIEQLINSTKTELATDISELEISVTDLSGDLTAIETQVNDLPAINDSTASSTSLYSSQKIENLVGTIDTKISQTNTKIESLETDISDKADQAELDTLKGTVSTLQTTVNSKANQSDLTALQGTVNSKADQTDLAALETKVDSKPNINDTAPSTISVYSSDKVDDLLNEISTGSGSVPPGGTAGQVLRKSANNATTEWSTIIDDSAEGQSSTTSTLSASFIFERLDTINTTLTSLENSKTNNADFNALETEVNSLKTTVSSKADQSDLDALETKVDGKPSINDSTASATSLYSSQKIESLVGAVDTKVEGLETDISELSETVSSKADQSDLTALQTTVNSKANQSELDTLEGTVSTLQTTVNNKADKSTVNAKQNKPTVKTITINASNWSSGVYTLSDNLITATSIQEWCLPVYTGSNTAEINALQAANIVDAGQSAGQAKIRCLGTVPTATVHMVVIFWG